MRAISEGWAMTLWSACELDQWGGGSLVAADSAVVLYNKADRFGFAVLLVLERQSSTFIADPGAGISCRCQVSNAIKWFTWDLWKQKRGMGAIAYQKGFLSMLP